MLTGKDSLFHKSLREVRALVQHFYHQKFAACTSVISKTLNYIRKHLCYPQQIVHIHLNYASRKLSTEARHMDWLNVRKPFWSLRIHRVELDRPSHGESLKRTRVRIEGIILCYTGTALEIGMGRSSVTFRLVAGKQIKWIEEILTRISVFLFEVKDVCWFKSTTCALHQYAAIPFSQSGGGIHLFSQTQPILHN